MIPSGKEKKKALDMAFGEAPESMEKVNMFCSRMQHDAIYSLILSASNLRHLELRGNNLDADFGWKIIKNMKNSYMILQTMNGMQVGKIKNNEIRVLDLVSANTGTSGVFGIEVVGAIFLAHFLRVNTSLEQVKFQNNDVEREGAKAISQAILSTPESNIRSVNHMGKRPKTDKGIDFAQFRKGQTKFVDLAYCNCDDDDIVFLTEWLERFDCVNHLDLGHNSIGEDGVLKLVRYVANSKKLRSFSLSQAPLDLGHVAAITKALKENSSLERVNFHIGAACGQEKDKQQMLHDLALVLAQHPTLKEFGSAPVKVDLIKGNYMSSYDPLAQRKSVKDRNDIAMALWLVAMCKPSSYYTLAYNTNRRQDGGYPDVREFVPFYAAPISSICLQLKDTLVNVDLGIPEGMSEAVDILKFLAGSPSLKKCYLRGYAGSRIDSIPPEWQDDGRLPSWMKSQIGIRRLHWQALHGFVAATPGLLAFNNVHIANYKPDSAERAMLLMFECIHDMTCQLEKGCQTQLYFMFGPKTDVAFALSVTRLVDRAPYEISINYAPETTYIGDRIRSKNKSWKYMTLQQADISNFLKQPSAGKDSPKFVHHLRLNYPFVTPFLVDAMAVSSNLREFTIDAIEKVINNLINSFTHNKNTQIERIRVERYWQKNRRVLKRFHEPEQQQLSKLQPLLTSQGTFQEIVSPAGRFSKANLQKSNPEEFAQKISGALVKYPPVAEVYSPNIMIEFVYDPKNSTFPPQDYKRLGMMIPLAPAHRHIKHLNLANCNIKKEVSNTARSDEFADSSRPLWEGKMACYRPNLFGPFQEKKGYDYNTFMRFHWHPNIRIGSSKSEIFLKAQGFQVEKDLMRLIIITLLKSPSLTSLDLRGNGFDKEDVMVVINQLEHNKYLKVLNGIPVVAHEASKATRLEFDGTGVQPITKHMKGFKGEDQAFGQATCKTQVVALDEGDGFLFASLVTANNFGRLKYLVIKRHRIPDNALTYICDAIAALPALEHLELQKIFVTNRGANMLLSVIAQRAQSLVSLNGLPVSQLKGDVDSGKGGGMVSSNNPVMWNDYSLAIASRLKFWGALRDDGTGKSMEIDTSSLTDVGLRGIAGKFKWLAAESSRNRSLLPIVRLDLSGNPRITDTAVADLCRNLLQPGEPTLQYLDTRYCAQLRARSAFELYYLLHPKTRPQKTMGTGRLQVVNGMDIKLLHESVKAKKPAPPFVVRLFAGARHESPTLSDSDAHFFAHVLHMFPNVSHCHVNVEVTQYKPVHAWHGDTEVDEITSSSPFRPPQDEITDEVQKQIDSSCRFFESVPVSTRTQFSCIPRIPVRTPKASLEGDVIVPFFTGAKAASESPGHFGQMVAALIRKKENRLKSLGLKPTMKKKPYYVNNINAQRMHDAFRTLYGVDDVELTHNDVFNPRNRKHRVVLGKVDFSDLLTISSSVDCQHLWFRPYHHLSKLEQTAGNKSTVISLLTHLNFQYSNFGDPGTRYLSHILVQASAHIIHLGLAWNNISDAGIKHLCAALPHLTKISSLDLSNNFIAESGGIELADRLGGYELTKRGSPYFSDDVKLLSLNLEGNKIRDKGAMRMAEFIAVNKYLQFINLRDNEIGFAHDEAIAAIVYCVTDNPVVSVLDLRDNFQKKRPGTQRYEKTRPPLSLMQGLVKDVNISEFDENEVYQGIFIRRKR